jgi:6-phosphogluconate dehydrogenase (decarboxylating)
MNCGMIGCGAADFADKVLSAWNNRFGRHEEKLAAPKGGA